MKDAVEIAKEYFRITNRRATAGTMRMTIGQATNLINAGFTPDEIIHGIEWCVKHSPPRGFNSLGWLSYDLENILIKVKAEQIKQEQNNIVFTPEKMVECAIERREKQVSERVKGFEFDMFDNT